MENAKTLEYLDWCNRLITNIINEFQLAHNWIFKWIKFNYKIGYNLTIQAYLIK